MSVSDHLFNAIGPALKAAKVWAPLTDRQKIADALEGHLRHNNVILVDATYLHTLERIAESQAGQSGESVTSRAEREGR